jgi:multiple sugar transport system substrate-binding protein
MRMRLMACGVSAALLLAACGGGGGDNEDSGDGPVEITFSHWAFTSPPFDRFVDIMDDFNKSQDEFVVKPENVPFENYHKTLFTQVGAGEGPTILGVDEAEFGQAMAQGLAADLTDSVEVPSEGLNSYDERLIDEDGKRRAVVFTQHPYQLLVNRTILDELGEDVPTTMDEFKEVAEAAAAKDGMYGTAFRHSMADSNGWWIDLTNWVYGQGGAWSDDEGNPTIDSPEVATALEEMMEFIDGDLIPVGTDAPTYRRMFWEGKIPMVIESLAFSSIFASQSEELAKGLEVHPLPFGSDRLLTINHAAFVNESASDREKEGAAAFLSYMLTDEVQQKMVDTMDGALPAKNLPFSDETVKNSPWLKGWTLPDTAVSFTPKGAETKFPALRSAVLEQFEQILAGRVSIDEGLKAAQAEAEAAIQ